jgi:release factor glutamine methyltransferase
MSTNSLAAAIRAAAETFSGTSATPRLDAEFLAAFALDMPRGEMLTKLHELPVPENFAALLARRSAHEPVAYITGTQPFWDLELHVSADVLIPRSDSETLIYAAISEFKHRPAPMAILDMGTGSGALLLAALSVFSRAKGIGIDNSEAALDIATDNAIRHGFADRTEMRHMNWRNPDWHFTLNQKFDLVLCNPPYVETNAELEQQVACFEPSSALFAGELGLDDYRIIIPALPDLLTDSGVAILEIGFTQAQAVGDMALAMGFRAALRHDLSNNPRCLTLTKA